MVRRVRDALAIAEALAAGKPPGQIRRTLRMPSYAADRLIADVSNRDVESYRRALELLADLEVESRGGGGGALSEDTAAVRAVHRRRALGTNFCIEERDGSGARTLGVVWRSHSEPHPPHANPVHRRSGRSRLPQCRS